MGRKRSVGKWLALGCGGLIVLLIVVIVAASAILRASGNRQKQAALARLKASGAPVTWEQAIPPPVPDDQNAAPLYSQAFAFLVLTQDQRLPSGIVPGTRTTLSEYLSAPTRRERKALEPQVRRILTENANALASLRDAARLPKCRSNRDYRDPGATLYPECAQMTRLSVLASAQALLRADAGDLPGALEAWTLNVKIVNHLESEPVVTGQMARYVILAVAAEALRPMLQDSRPTPEQCRSLAQALGGLDIEGAFIKAMEAERCLQLWMFDKMQEDPRYLDFFLGGTSDAASQSPDRSKRGTMWLGLRFTGSLEEAAALRLWEQQMALLRKPYRQMAGQVNTLGQDLPSYLLLARGVVAFSRTAVPRDQAITLVGQMRIALGLAAYRAHHGAYPDSLRALRESLKWQVPEDPFSGKDFVYQRAGQGYLLYSIGPNLQDDGGTPPQRDRIGQYTGDIVWRVER